MVLLTIIPYWLLELFGLNDWALLTLNCLMLELLLSWWMWLWTYPQARWMLKHNSLFEYITLLWKRVGQGKGRTGGVARNILGERWSQKRLHCKRLKLATKLRCAKSIHLPSERPQLTSLTTRVA
jgi:hypothetical protein